MFIVIELQTNASGAVANIVTQHATQNEAESKYHTILAAAAISNVPIHAAMIVTNKGRMLASEYYEHGTEAE